MTEIQAADIRFAQYAREAAVKAGDVAAEAFRAGFIGAEAVDEKKSYADIVTATDKECERLIAEYLAAAVPDSVVLGEEYGQRGEGDVTWVVDPIDGTSNFASGLPNYSVSIGAYVRGEAAGGAVYDPERGEIFSSDPRGFSLNGRWNSLSEDVQLRDATCELLTNLPYENPAGVNSAQLSWFGEWIGSFRAVRRLGSCALHGAYVAAGRAGVCVETQFSAWDIAAGSQLVKAAGGSVIAWDDDGEPVDDVAAGLNDIRGVVFHSPGFDIQGSSVLNAVPERVVEELRRSR